MKYTYQIVGAAQFEYIMGEGDFQTSEAVVAEYKGLREAFHTKAGSGLLPKDFNKAVDEYCSTGTLLNGTELYAQMNEKQQFFFQTLKNSDKRREAKNK